MIIHDADNGNIRILQSFREMSGIFTALENGCSLCTISLRLSWKIVNK